jgi:hypothetical protein
LVLIAASAKDQLAPADHKARDFAERAAYGQAIRQLIEDVFALKITNTETLGDLVGAQEQMDAELRFFIAAAQRIGPARRFSDGACEVDVRLTVDELADTVQHLASKYLQDPPIRLSADAVREAADGDYLWATGTADEPPAEQLADAEQIPRGFEALMPSAPDLARQAAELDAFTRLARSLARHSRLPSIGADHLADLLMANATGIAVSQVTFHPGAICTLRIAVTPERAEQVVREAGADLSAAARSQWLDSLRRTTQGEAMEATGYGVPPAGAWRTPRELWLYADPPSWHTHTLRLTATVRLSNAEHAAGDLQAMAADAARIEGIRRFAEQVDALTLPDGIGVATFLVAHPEMAEDVAMFLSSARTLSAPSYDADAATATVQMELPLGRLWRVLKARMVFATADQAAPTTAGEGDQPVPESADKE